MELCANMMNSAGIRHLGCTGHDLSWSQKSLLIIEIFIVVIVRGDGDRGTWTLEKVAQEL